MDYLFIGSAFIGLLAIINPISTVFVFLSITKGDSERKKKDMAYKAVLISAIVLIVFSTSGFLIFKTFNITIEAFKIGGGILLTNIGFKMIHAKKRASEEELKDSLEKEDVSIIPLAIPMLSGPGAITAMLVWTSNAPGISERIALIFLPVLISIICYYILINAKIIEKALRPTGSNVVARLMGLIVLVLGVQFILNGLYDIVPRILNIVA